MATWTNQTQSATTFQNALKDGDAYWADVSFTWNDAFVYWGGSTNSSWSQPSKASTSFTNAVKN